MTRVGQINAESGHTSSALHPIIPLIGSLGHKIMTGRVRRNTGGGVCAPGHLPRSSHDCALGHLQLGAVMTHCEDSRLGEKLLLPQVR